MTFYLDHDLARLLIEKFQRFQQDRQQVHRRRLTYIEDFPDLETSRTDSWADMQERYDDDPPNLSHLSHDATTGQTLWSQQDIAILLGRHVSSLSRNLKSMEQSAEWSDRLTALRQQSPHSESAWLYTDDIFDLIIDFYEWSWLHRFFTPRRGEPLPEPECREILAFWSYLKEKPETSTDDLDSLLIAGLRPRELALPGVDFLQPPLSWRAACRLIASRVFSLRVGTLFISAFGLYYQAVQQDILPLWLGPLLCLAALGISLPMVKKRRSTWFNPAHLGAGALIFMALWGLFASITWREHQIAHAPAAMPAAELRAQKLLGNEHWLTFKNGTQPNLPIYYDTSVHPSSIDLTPLVNALQKGRFSKVFYGINTTEPQKMVDVNHPCVIPDTHSYRSSGLVYVALWFQIPDGTLLGPLRIPNLAPQDEHLTDSERYLLDVYLANSGDMLSFAATSGGLYFSLYSLHTGWDFWIVEDVSGLPRPPTTLFLQLPQKGRTVLAELPSLAPNGTWAFFSANPVDSIFDLFGSNQLFLSEPKGSLMTDAPLPSLALSIIRQDFIAPGNLLITASLTNKTGHRIDHLLTRLKVRHEGKIIAWAEETPGVFGKETLYQESTTYKAYRFLVPSPFPEDASFELGVEALVTRPPLRLLSR